MFTAAPNKRPCAGTGPHGMKPACIIADINADMDFCPICDAAFDDMPDAEFVVRLHRNQFGQWVSVSYHYACYEADPMRQLRTEKTAAKTVCAEIPLAICHVSCND